MKYPIVIAMALAWAPSFILAQAHASDYQVVPPDPPIYYEPQQQQRDWSYRDGECRPGCQCEYDISGRPEVDCSAE